LVEVAVKRFFVSPYSEGPGTNTNKCKHTTYLRVLEPALRKHAGQALADQPRDIVAVEVILLERHRALPQVLGDELGHPRAHALGDVLDHGAHPGAERLEDARYAGELLQEAGLVALFVLIVL
jgi:hypothetical protein